MAVHRVPNVRLRELLLESRWTGAQLARAVNRIGAESGLRGVAYQRASVHQWLTGTQPRGPVAHLVCAALTERLGRTVGLAEAGFDGGGPSDTVRAAGAPPASPRSLLTHLAAAALSPDRDGSVLTYQPTVEARSAARATALPPPGSTLGLRSHGSGGPDGSDHGGPPAGPHLLALLLPVFSSADQLRGGGHARTALAAFLSSAVPDMLAAAASPVRHTEVLAAASRLGYLCAFMHFDDELNGLALHFYRFALELARQCGDPAAQAMTLRAMAAQAYELNHPQESLSLARAAAELRLSTTATRLRASVLGQLALAEAATGDRVAAVRHVHEAFDLLPRIEGPAPAVGDYHRAAWDHHHALVQAELGDLSGAIKSLEASAARRPRTETRSHALVLGKLAERQLAAGRLDAACATWHQFLDVYPLLTSRRAHSAAARLHRRLLPHRRRHPADHLLQRAASLRLPR
ncbi:tetratricopeptide repeat protein [Kitasatospora sp. NPDC051853]|uniref:tetratricopeptide repeat protein n=1 Tax=Kitasatospora sp. NPDC051853 TaxID=3364058 RepID=UPI0037A1420E